MIWMNKAIARTVAFGTIAAGAVVVGGVVVTAANANQPESPRAQVSQAIEKLTEPTTVTVTNNTWHSIGFAPRGSVAPLVVEPGESVRTDTSLLTAAASQLSAKVIYSHSLVNLKAATPVAGKSSIQVGKNLQKIADGGSATFVKGKHSVTVERSDDGGSKELQITINS